MTRINVLGGQRPDQKGSGSERGTDCRIPAKPEASAKAEKKGGEILMVFSPPDKDAIHDSLRSNYEPYSLF
mgnify:CR=1 FL=1